MAEPATSPTAVAATTSDAQINLLRSTLEKIQTTAQTACQGHVARDLALEYIDLLAQTALRDACRLEQGTNDKACC